MISIPDINQEELLNDCIDGIQVKDVETRERKTRIEIVSSPCWIMQGITKR